MMHHRTLCRARRVMLRVVPCRLFVQKGCIGVFVGSGETQNWAIGTILASASALAMYVHVLRGQGTVRCRALNVGRTARYFGLINTIQKTTVVGMTNMIPPYIFVFVACLVFLQKKYLRKFRLRESMCARRKLKVAVQVTSGWAVCRV